MRANNGNVNATDSESCIMSPSRIIAHTSINNDKAYEKDLTDHIECDSLKEMVSERRKDNDVNPNDKVFISIAWVSQPHLCYVQMFPEVIHVDATSHSTSTQNILLTFSIKISTRKQFVFFRIWLEDQRHFSFRWVFMEALDCTDT